MKEKVFLNENYIGLTFAIENESDRNAGFRGWGRLGILNDRQSAFFSHKNIWPRAHYELFDHFMSDD